MKPQNATVLQLIATQLKEIKKNHTNGIPVDMEMIGACINGAESILKQEYDSADLASFGQYLLSPERKERITSNWDESDSCSLEERLSVVYHADLEKWKFKQSITL
jgi:hypothetical protein